MLEDLEIEEDVVTVPADETPVPGGTLRYGLEADVDGLNPTSSALVGARPDDGQRRVRHADRLRRRRRRRPLPRRVGRAGVEGDFSKWVVTIRQGISFHDGTPVTIDAVILGFETQTARPARRPRRQAVLSRDRRRRDASTTSPRSSTCSSRTRSSPGALTGQLGYVSSPDVARRRARRPDAQPAAGRLRTVRVRQPFTRLGDPLRAQRGLVERRRLPRRRRVRPGARRRHPRRTAARRATSTPCRRPTRAPSRRSTRTRASSRSRTRPAKRASS